MAWKRSRRCGTGNGALQKLEAYLERLCASRPSPEEALTLAIQLEEQLARVHMSSIVAFEDPELLERDVFKAFDSDSPEIRQVLDILREAQEEHLKRIHNYSAAHRTAS